MLAIESIRTGKVPCFMRPGRVAVWQGDNKIMRSFHHLPGGVVECPIKFLEADIACWGYRANPLRVVFEAVFASANPAALVLVWAFCRGPLPGGAV